VVRTLSLTDLDAVLANDGVQVVEVLPSEEHAWAHLPAAISIPLKELDSEGSAAALDRRRPVVVYCNDFL
jgi:rhodanese-related sulfurtransferase